MSDGVMQTSKFFQYRKSVGAWWGVNLTWIAHAYNEVAKTRRQLKFYGFHVGWVMIGITVVKRTK